MSNITFDESATEKAEKENIEWIRVWCPDTNCENLPRVALVGDSITEGYYKAVKELLSDVAHVDYLATSYSIASDTYKAFVQGFLADSDYKVVHFNYGLHAYGVSDDVYGARCKALLADIKATTVVATSTNVLDAQNLDRENPHWKDKVLSRNRVITAIAEELALPINDLYTVSVTLDKTMRRPDGVHFLEDGYRALAAQVAAAVRQYL
jgi:lysophospholipase L1-like esterase